MLLSACRTGFHSFIAIMATTSSGSKLIPCSCKSLTSFSSEQIPKLEAEIRHIAKKTPHSNQVWTHWINRYDLQLHFHSRCSTLRWRCCCCWCCCWCCNRCAVALALVSTAVLLCSRTPYPDQSLRHCLPLSHLQTKTWGMAGSDPRITSCKTLLFWYIASHQYLAGSNCHRKHSSSLLQAWKLSRHCATVLPCTRQQAVLQASSCAQMWRLLGVCRCQCHWVRHLRLQVRLPLLRIEAGRPDRPS